MMTGAQLIRKVKRLLKCDAVRIVDFAHTRHKFLVISHQRHSSGEWVNRDEERQDFGYLEEHCIASGDSIDDLWREACQYARLCREDAVRRGQELLWQRGRVAMGICVKG